MLRARGADRRDATTEAAGQDDRAACCAARAREAERRRASFDAWVKYYRSDENTPNATISYYTKGSLVALAFDLTIRARKAAQVARRRDAAAVAALRHATSTGGGGAVGEDEVEALFAEATGVELASCSSDSVHGTARPAARRAVRAVRRHAFHRSRDERHGGKPSLGVRVRAAARRTLAVVHEGGAAQKAGLSAGDVLIAIDGLRVTGRTSMCSLSRYLPGAKVEVHAFRRDELRRTELKTRRPGSDALHADSPADGTRPGENDGASAG